MRGKIYQPTITASANIQKMHQGLIFYAKEGNSVHSISPGKVVFADRLTGYGLLMIIDHGWGFMSLYGNNSKLLKNVGTYVAANEEIAKIGHSGVLQKNGLYFEIRHNGKTLPPLTWLQH